MEGSRFYRGKDDAVSSSSSGSSSEDEKPQQKQDQQPTKLRNMGKWAEASSSEDEKKKDRGVVQSQNDKRFAQIRDAVKVMKNHIKIEDFSALLSDYAALNQSYEKLKVALKEDEVPKFFIQALGLLEQFVARLHQSGDVKKMSKSKATAFNTLRHKMRKENKKFEDDLKQYEEHPSEFEDAGGQGDDNDNKSSEADDSGTESDDEGAGDDDGDKSSSSDSSSSSSKSSAASGSDSDGDSGSSGSSGWDPEEESSSDEDLDGEARRRKRMQKWLKTESDYEDERREREKMQKQKDDKEALKKKKEGALRLAQERKRLEPDAGPTTHAHQQKQEENFSFEELTQKIVLVAQTRGRKGMDKATLRKTLDDYMAKLDKFDATNWKLYIVSHLISVEFDKTEGAFKAIRHEAWVESQDNIHRMLELFESWNVPSNTEKPADDMEKSVSFPVLVDVLISHLENLDDELYKSLQFSGDATTVEFQSALQNSHSIIRVLRRAMRFLEKANLKVELGKISSRLIEQLYYRHDDISAKVYSFIQEEAPEDEKHLWVWPTDSIGLFEQLRRNVDQVNDPRMRVRALLCQVYHLALHDHYRKARNLLHFSNAVERVSEMATDVNTQILYNRVLGQLGLCAFRQMMIYEAHNALVELCMYMKTKELLAQGMSYYKYQERSEEQEKKEKKRQVPYPMHIDLDFLECVHLISAMLLEIPNMAHQALEPNNKKIISKPMRRHIEQQNHQILQTPPENARETVICAARCLQKADWQKCIAIIDDLKFWRNIGDADSVRKLLRERIKVEALRTFMFTSLCSYTAFNIDQLVDFFELPNKKVHSTVSKMIINNEIPASWDSTSQYIVVQRSELTYLHKLALELSDRVVSALENNERTLDVKCGNKEGVQQKGQHMQQRWDGHQQNRRGFGRGRGPPVLDDAQRNRKGKGKGQNGKGKSQRGGYGGNTNWDGYNRDGYNRGQKGDRRDGMGYQQRGRWGQI
eukprot:GEMP01008412.1.p1 GENE.GEMP01008412.1~~GEMP01008412.1.p1  ORF type:complete len:1006 (+),score=263.00 GEMP01008412.1:74-3019(+)